MSTTARYLLLTVLFASTLGSFAQAAGACTPCFWQGDRKTLPGAACDLRLDSESTSYGVDWRGGVCNFSFSDPLKVSCPVVRDNTDNLDGLHCAQAYFYHDAGSAEALCVLYARQTSGAGNYYSTSQTLNVGAGSFIGLHINNSYNRGYYHMTCLVPPKSGGGDYSCLRSFQWGE